MPANKGTIDPLAAAQELIDRSASSSILCQEPLATWLSGICERKAHGLTWANIRLILLQSCQAVLEAEPGTKIRVGKEIRPATDQEIETCRGFAENPLKERAVADHAKSLAGGK